VPNAGQPHQNLESHLLVSESVAAIQPVVRVNHWLLSSPKRPMTGMAESLLDHLINFSFSLLRA
jgi:hypothetical protein